MLFGSRHGFGLEIDPVHPTWERRGAVEEGPWARLSLWVGGRNLTANVLPGTDSVQAGVFVPLISVADWFARNARYICFEESPPDYPADANLVHTLSRWRASAAPVDSNPDAWDDARFEWAQRHFVALANPDLWLPNIAWARSGDVLWVSWGPTNLASPSAPVFVNREGTCPVDWAEASRAIDAFLAEVGRAVLTAGRGSEFPWAPATRLFGAMEHQIGWREYVEAAIAIAPGRVLELFGAGTFAALPGRLNLPEGASPLQSSALLALRDLRGTNGVGPPLVALEKYTQTRGTSRYLEARGVARDASRTAEQPEAQGQAAARALRGWLGLGDEPVADLTATSVDGLGVGVVDGDGGSADDYSVAGARVDGGAAGVFVLDGDRAEVPWARRMEIARAVGHLLLDAESAFGCIGAGSSSRTTGPRRRRSGAFAAEILLPDGAMRVATGARLDAGAHPEVFQHLMSLYGVGARTAAWQLFNAGLLASRDRADDLIERFGATVNR